MSNKKFFSSGKVILSGEHSVVYGEPALVSAIDLGVEAFVSNSKVYFNPPKNKNYLQNIFKIFKEKYDDKKLNLDDLVVLINSNLPEKSGLGSSAAVAHAVVLSLADFFKIKISLEEIFKLVQEAEKYIHGVSSGIDPSAVVFGGVQVFKKGVRKKLSGIAKLDFTLVNSGDVAETTGEMIDLVRSKVETDGRFSNIIKKIGVVTSDMIKSININNFNPKLLTQNQRLLEELGVVGERAKKIVKEIESLGGFVKITGAGGVKNGSGWLLAYHPNKKVLTSFLTENTIENYRIEVK